MKTSKSTNFFKSEEYKNLKTDIIRRAVNYAKTGMGYNTMRIKLNDLMEKSGANSSVANDSESIILGRRILAQQVGIAALPEMNTQQSNHLFDELLKIAEDDAPGRSENRGLKR